MKTKRYYASMYNVDQNLLSKFIAPNHDTQYTHYSYNEETGVAEVYMEFEKQVYTNSIKYNLAGLGARSINGMTFQNNDSNHSAASALNRVRAVAKSEGFIGVVHGTCNPKLLAKADELLAAEKQGKDAEFDEKTHAVLKLSLENTEEIKSTMATKEGLSHLENITQIKADEIKTSFMQMNAKMQSDYKITITGQAVIISDQTGIINSQQKANAELNESIIINDRKMMNLERHNDSQRFIIAKLNTDRDNMTKEVKDKDQIILQLTKDNLTLRSSQGSGGAVTVDQLWEVMSTFHGERKRKHDE
jgi:hypothetical protein